MKKTSLKTGAKSARLGALLVISTSAKALLLVLALLTVNDCVATPINFSGSSPGRPKRIPRQAEKQTEQNFGAHHQKAVAAVRQNNTKAALEWIKKSRKNGRSELAPAEILLAKICFQEGQRTQALNALEQAAMLHPTDPETHLLLADQAWRERRFSDSHLQYKHAKNLAEKWSGSTERKEKLLVWAIAGLGSIAETRGQLETAYKHFTAILKFQPKHQEARFRLGNILFRMGRLEEALKAFHAVSKENPDRPSPSLVIANLYRQSGESKKVEHWLLKAMEEEPDSPKPVVLMARFQLQEQSQSKKALKYLDQAEQHSKPTSETQLLRGLSLWQMGDLPAAEKVLDALAFKEPGNVEVNSFLAAVLAEQGGTKRLERAQELAGVTATANKQSVEAATAVGWTAFLNGNLDLAAKQLKAVVTTPNAGRDAKYYLARALFRKGQITTAKKLLEQALGSQGLFIHFGQAKKWHAEIGADR